MTTVKQLECPTCKAPEVLSDGLVAIRAYKVHSDGHWWSQCLRCSGVLDKDLEPTGMIRGKGGWFHD